MNISLQLGRGFSSISATNSAEFHLTVQRREVDLVLSIHGASSISVKTFVKVRVLYSRNLCENGWQFAVTPAGVFGFR